MSTDEPVNTEVINKEPESIMPPQKRKYKIVPSPQQIKAVQLVAQGYSASKALREAGYSKRTARLSTGMLKGRGFQVALESMFTHLENAGINNEYMAGKYKEWLDAKKTDHSHTEPDKEVPDYEIQIKAAKLLHERQDKIIGLKGGGGVKRKLTIEEFVTGEDK